MSYWVEVQTYTLCDGWTNVWSEEGEPWTFESFSDAWCELADHFETCRQCGVEFSYDEYRIVEFQDDAVLYTLTLTAPEETIWP